MVAIHVPYDTRMVAQYVPVYSVPYAYMVIPYVYAWYTKLYHTRHGMVRVYMVQQNSYTKQNVIASSRNILSTHQQLMFAVYNDYFLGWHTQLINSPIQKMLNV